MDGVLGEHYSKGGVLGEHYCQSYRDIIQWMVS